MRRTTKISLVCAAVLAGLAFGRAGGAEEWPVCLALGVVMLACVVRFPRVLVLSLMILAMAAGLWRTERWHAEQSRLTALIGTQVALTGRVADDPAASASGQVNFTLNHLRLENGQKLPGEISIHIYPVRLQRGYLVQVTGKVKPGYGNQLAEMGFPKLQTVSTRQSLLEQFRQHFFAGMRTALPEPLSSFGLGLLVGIRALIPKDLQAQLTLVGLAHLVAVSGYNLTILVRAASRLLKRFGRSAVLAGSAWLIAGFLIVTGASASIVRASVVAGLSLLAAHYGRRFRPVTLILLVATTTALWNPTYLTDLGWLLSFLGFFGVLVVAPAIEARVGGVDNALGGLLIETLSAELVTLPLVLFIFGNLSFVAPLTNLVVLPFVPLAMLVSAIAGLAGMLVPAFAGWFAWPAALLLGFLLKLVAGFAALPWAGRTYYIALPVMLGCYSLIVSGLVISRTRASKKTKIMAE